MFEAGFFPGIVLYLTYWFPPRRRASVMSIFFAGVMVAGVLGGLYSVIPNAIGALALLSTATVLLFAAMPIFWAIPASHLSAEARASGIKTATGSMDNALHILGVLIVPGVSGELPVFDTGARNTTIRMHRTPAAAGIDSEPQHA